MSKVFGYINKVKNAKDGQQCSELYEEIQNLKAEDGSQQDIADLICACLTNPKEYIFKSAEKLVKLIKWKNFSDGIGTIVDKLLTKPDTTELDNNPDSSEADNVYSALKSFAETLINSTKALPSNENVASKWCQLEILVMPKCHKWYVSCFQGLSSDTPNDWFVVKPSLKEQYISAMTVLVEEQSEPFWYLSNSVFSLCAWTWMRLCQSIKADSSHKKCWDAAYKLWNMLQKRDFVDESDSVTFFGLAAFHLLLSFLVKQITQEKCDSSYYEMFLPSILKWRNKSDVTKSENDYVKQHCEQIVAYLMANNPNILPQDDIDSYCKKYLQSRDIQALGTIITAHQNGNDTTKHTIEKYSSQFVEMLSESTNDSFQLGQLLIQLYNSNPKDIRNKIDVIESAMSVTSTGSSTAINVLQAIVQKERSLFKNKGNNYLNMVRKFNNEYGTWTTACLTLLKNIAFINEDNANRIVDMMDDEMKRCSNNQYILQTAISSEYEIAQMYPNMFRKRISVLEKYKSYPQLKGQVQAIIDLAEGRSLQKVSTDVLEQDKNIKRLDEDVGKNKNNIDKLDKRVDQHDTDINHNRENIERTKLQVNNLDERVDKAEDKIEDIDNKTVSNAPAWSKEVSKLLNPKNNNDWTLVAQRLSYNSSEIRGWATQPDPTMSMLAEFYTTNKTSEATKYLLKVLKDVNRQDAVAVIERYQKQSENVIMDNNQESYKAPPGVFISYQWGVQKQIKLLKEHIEKDGYPCWMDLGQMGGGDMLYEKIDDGIRSAKIVILCMTDQYCKSANCIREANLANGLDKTCIPIILEKDLPWPPPGSMGPILAGKLFIRFFQRDNEKTNDERFWPPDKYNELMDKIRGAVGKSDKQVSETRNAAPVKEGPRTCQVCITCSPDKEPSMKTLQRDLQALGYSTIVCCYVEDSVADVQADVYITALCLRYTKSSLALKEIETVVDQMKKPLIPLLMDRTEYPPMGQTKKYFTRISPIPCYNNNPTNGSQQFDDIVELIDSYKKNSDTDSGPRQSISKSDSSGSLNRRKVRSNVLDQNYQDSNNRSYSHSTSMDRRYSQPTRRGQEYNNFFKNTVPNRKPKKREEESLSYHPDGPKLPSLYRQKLNNRY